MPHQDKYDRKPQASGAAYMGTVRRGLAKTLTVGTSPNFSLYI